MFSHLWGMRVAAIVAAAASLSACRTFSPDGGMDTVAMVAGTGLNKDVVQVRSAEDAAAVRTRVTRLLHRPLSADAAVQIALLNNLGLQAAYNRLGIAEALAVKASRPPALSFAISEVSTPIELDIERKIMGSLLSLLTMPARTKIAADQFAQAELRAAEETLRVAAETRRAYVRAVATRQIVAALGEAKSSAEASADLAGQLKQTGAVNKLDQARRQVFATEMDAGFVDARQQAVATREKLTRLMGLWHADLDAYLPSALPSLPGSTRSLRAIEQDALNTRVDVQMARLQMEAMAKSYGLTRKTHFLNVLDAAGISKIQKDRGEKRADGGGYELVLEVPLFDFGKANVREAEQRYLEAANQLGQIGMMPRRKRVRPTAPIAPPMPSRESTKARCCPCTRPSRQKPSCNTTPCRSTPSPCLKRRGRGRERKWQASRPSETSGSPRPISAWRCLAAAILPPNLTR